MRLDKRGRKIGRNWWREMNTDLLLDATHAWEAKAEQVCIGYATELAEYAEHTPRPNLKQFLLLNKGYASQPE